MINPPKDCLVSKANLNLLKDFKLTPFQARLTSTLINKSGYTKISGRDLSKANGNRAYKEELEALPYIEQTGYTVGSQVKGYRIEFGLHKKLTENELHNLTSDTKAEYLNLITGKRQDKKIITQSLFRSALQRKVGTKYQPIYLSNFTKSLDKFLVGRELKQQLNAYCAALAFLKTGKYDQKLDLVVSRPVYCERSTGRIFSGFQTAPRELQALLFEEYLNYDIEASQLNILIQEKTKINQKTDKLEYFLHEKNTIIKDLNITKDLFKKILYTLIFGGNLPSPTFNKKRSLNEAVNDYCIEKGQEYATLVKSIIECFGFLEEEIKAFHDQLNSPINCLGLKCASKERRKLAAHHIQAIEAQWIALVVSKSKGVHLNMHDGLVCSDEIDKGVIDFANKTTALELVFALKSIA